jgi:hypothetical protein
MIKYDVNYYYHLLKIHSGSAEKINNIRWDFVKEINPKLVLDYGCGCGFFKAFAPEGITVDTYDILPVPQTGILHDFYDLITFWDVLEHENWGNLERNPSLVMDSMFDRTNFVALTVPILPPEKEFLTWKHRKPNEHKYYFSIDILNRFFSVRGFIKISSGYPENIMREDIYSALYGRYEKINFTE